MPIIYAKQVAELYPEAKKADGRYGLIDDVTKFTLPGVEFGSADIAGSGLAGTLSLPDVYNPGAMEFGITARSLRDMAAEILGPDGAEFRIAWAVEQMASGGAGGTFDAYMATIKGWAKGLPGPDIEKGNPMEAEMTYSVWYYKLTRNGETLWEIDTINQIIVVNGVDYTDKLKAALGRK